MENEARLTIRLPGRLKAWLERTKEAEGSTVNYEIIRSVRERMDRDNSLVAESAGADGGDQ